MRKKLIWTIAVTLVLAVTAASIIKLVKIRERHTITAREDSDFLHPMAHAIRQYKETHGKSPTSLEDLPQSETISRFVASEYYRSGKLIWNTDGRWQLDNKNRPICWFWSDDHWFYVCVLSENGDGELVVETLRKKELIRK